MKRPIIFLLLALSLTARLSADVYIKTVTRVEAIEAMGQNIPARESVSEQWISDDFYFVETGEGFAYLFDSRQGLVYLISHRTKSYLEIKPPVHYASLLPAELATMAQALEQMTISVQPTGETRVINNIKCQGYRLEMTMMMYPVEITVWASEELPVNLKKFLEKIWPEFIKLELKASSQMVAEISKIHGLWISQESKAQVMGTEVKSRAEVVEISKKSPPRNIYALPQGYRKKNRLEMEDIQGF
ncbi:MAG: hypothetical protein QME69_00895 [Candidatus Saccharicenans sp.]|nr:hypothetical protein [Candidatus Saccharicenans sp.]